MNHTPHILAAVFLCGLWLPIWILIAITHQDVWRCAFCGYTNALQYLVNPALMEQEFAARQQQQIIDAQKQAQRQRMLAEMPYNTLGDKMKYAWAAQPAIVLVAGAIVFFIGTFLVISFASAVTRSTATPNSAANTSTLSSRPDTYKSPISNVAISTPIPTPTVKSVIPSAPTITKTAMVISENANLRETPDPNGNVLVTVSYGETVDVIKQSGPWFQVRYAGSTGWLHGNTIQLN